MTLPDSEHDLLIRIDAKVAEIHADMTQPHGRVPRLEEKVEEHGSQINFWRGGIAVCVLLILALGAAFLAHVMGGK
jgi:hypothetical protein